jgi:opine dehydrogenase
LDSSKNFAVIGAGNGGKAMAAHLALSGFRVTLYNRTFEHISQIKARMGIDLESVDGEPHGFAKLELVTSNMSEALKDADVIMVVVPSSAHADVAKNVASHLADGQIVVLHPGRTFGALEFVKVLRDSGCVADVTVAEAETLIFICRSEGPSKARVYGIKDAVPIAAFPAVRTKLVLDAIRQVFPQFIDGINVLHTGLNNMGAVLHPALTILNAGRIEATQGDFKFYIEGLTPSVGRVLEILDSERMKVVASLGIRGQTALEWVQMAYHVTGKDLREAIHNQPGYFEVKAPSSLNHRYIFEDVPTGLVPIASLGKTHGVSVNGISSIIQMGCIIHHTDYWSSGRSLEKLGLSHFSISELTRYVNEGQEQDV